MTPEQAHASQKSQMNQWFEMAGKSLEESEKLLELNFNACRDALHEMARCCQTASDVRDMPSAFNWQLVAFKPFAELSAQYGARLMGLASSSGRELSRGFENQWHGMTRQMTGWMGDMPRSGVQGPEAMFEYMRNSMRAFDTVWDTTRQNLQQAQETAERNAQIVEAHGQPHAQPHEAAAEGGDAHKGGGKGGQRKSGG